MTGAALAPAASDAARATGASCAFTLTNNTGCTVVGIIVRNQVPYYGSGNPNNGPQSPPLNCLDSLGNPTQTLLQGADCSGTVGEVVNVCAGGVMTDHLVAVGSMMPSNEASNSGRPLR